MIGWRDGEGGLHHDSLFGVFAALARGEAWSFSALRPHQREPWHAFTVQVAALALIRAGLGSLPADEAAWRDLLIGLTPDQPDGEAWTLVVDDWAKPALLQPPVVATANRAEYKNRLATPDALDMLITARNHDVKQERIAEASEEDWLFALVTLQTSEGFGGRDTYGISRMNGGQSNRMSLGVRPAGGAGAAFRRDVLRLVAEARTRPDRRKGLALLWTQAWDGTVALAIDDLDELYVEICRRARLVRDGGGIVAWAGTSKCARVAASEIGGNTGDPWAPLVIDTKKGRVTEGKLISVTASGSFGYRRMANLLDARKVTAPLLAQLHEEDDRGGLSIVAAALVRGQGKTEGLHRRTVRTSRIEELSEYGPEVVLDRVGNVAKRRADEAGEASVRLRRALISLVQGGPDQARLDDDAAKKKVEPWVERFELVVDRAFFDDPLWEEAAGKAIAPKTAWRRQLHGWADQTFAQATEAAPRTTMRRVRAVAQASRHLNAQMAKWLKEVPDGE